MSYYLWIAAAGTGLVGAFWLLLSGRRQQEQQRTRLQVNRELYEQRKQEIASEQADGLLTESAARQARVDLDRRFVAENSELEQVEDIQMGQSIWLPASVVLVLSLVLYAVFGGWQQQQQADQAIAALPELGRQVLSDSAAQTTPEELQTFALGLRQKLAVAPDDPVAWLVYGRVMTAMQQTEQAINAYEKSFQLNPDRAATLLSYAQLLLQTGDDEYLRRAAQLLARLLEQDPTNTEGLSLLGFVAFQRQDWAEAASAWRLLAQQLPAESEQAQAVQQAIADAEQRQAAADLELTVTVTVAAALREQIPKDATLFVYVRDPQGPPMPAAVVRQPLESWPVTVTLSDANAMLPDIRLSTLNQWQVMARISSDEQIDSQPGDFDATAVIIEAQADQEVQLVIDQPVSVSASHNETKE
ncbi:MAG TPA: c-type cytochrome biogenesis protein CcmI [Pseudidiomarina sp.]|nr:c-type cytochrome biogenesis protein CcmI [Pseudidiomarina sp.]